MRKESNLRNIINRFPGLRSRSSVTFISVCWIIFLSAITLTGVLNSCGSEDVPHEYRSIDGYNNNLKHPQMNQAEVGTRLIRKADSAYADGIGHGIKKEALSGLDRPNPRSISNIVTDQPDSRSIPNSKKASDFFWLWGQFLSHDVSFVNEFRPHERVNVSIPIPKEGEPADPFDPQRTGNVLMMFNRAIYDLETGTSKDNPREQVNKISGWIDATNIYSNSEGCLSEIRKNDGTGRLKASDKNLLPHADDPEFCFLTVDDFFLSGDERVNENIGLTSLNTVFVLEHNRLADEIRKKSPNLSGDEIFEKAKNIITAQIQKITYEDFLPFLLGERIPEYKGYNEDVDASVVNVWAVAGFRLGHTLLSSNIRIIDSNGNETQSIPLRDAFREPEKVVEIGIESILRGFASQVCQEVDVFIRNEFRNFLFGHPRRTGNPVIGGLDLVTLNIQRARDHGIPDYNTMREAYGLSRNDSFKDISSDQEVQDRLKKAYGTTDNIDVWVGGLAEDSKGKSMLGELFHTIVVDQFVRLRDGDRFWYERNLSKEELEEVQNATLADIIIRSTDVGEGEIQDDVFRCDASCKTP